MTLKGGETPGKETVHLKGGGTFTAKYKKGTLFRSGYWYGLGKAAPRGRFDSLRKLKSEAQRARDESRKTDKWSLW